MAGLFLIKLNCRATFSNHYSMMCLQVCRVHCVCWIGTQSKCLLHDYTMFIVFFPARKFVCCCLGFFVLLAIVHNLRGMCTQHNSKKSFLQIIYMSRKTVRRIAQCIKVTKGTIVTMLVFGHLRYQTLTEMDGKLTGRRPGLLVQLYNPRCVKSGVIQREEAEKKKREAKWAAGWAGLRVERCQTSRGLCTYIILISAAKSNVSNVGVLTITSITGLLNGCSVSAALHWTFH